MPRSIQHPLFDPVWLAALHARANQPPLQPRVPLAWGEHVMGSVLPHYFDEIARLPSSVLDKYLSKEERAGGVSWRVKGEGDGLSDSLNALAQALHDVNAGQVRAQWRGEQLAVCNAQGQRLGTVERGVVRPLGLATQAVHLVGWAGATELGHPQLGSDPNLTDPNSRGFDSRMWVQQRAFNKATNPGQWDTLMGGLISAQDSLESALARETWEEAGLVLAELQDVRHSGHMTLRAPCEGDPTGYVVEHTDWFTCTVPATLTPVNQDGEVAQFALPDMARLLSKLQQGEFTTEAALILVAVLANSG